MLVHVPVLPRFPFEVCRLLPSCGSWLSCGALGLELCGRGNFKGDPCPFGCDDCVDPCLPCVKV